jgi:hypothetical protein
MTMLVLVSLAAIVDAMTGLGRIPIRNKNGINPYIGVTVGQASEVSAAARAPAPAAGQTPPMNAHKTRDTVPNATPAVRVIFIPSRGRGLRRAAAPSHGSMDLIIAYRHYDDTSI